ncbi:MULTISPECIES: metallophosphoesterase family protein [Brevibacillus]|uniref:metallophosphoesterase family protein n=1 Tax=Brevibacillus TaxID=55080 RepID=UPI0020425513|nr:MULTISPECIES: metallophosphoesterase family protein [Brevibacillus]MCM3079243.1 serine/threonine protein phosphatase [Brevibacillus invocatus]MCM3429214.1 serine/threonine protein phosphatase [Brevibacillus invocatus]MDH4615595.1 serine/threonine protein phosphatase [Brevibacillus sp. AY1]
MTTYFVSDIHGQYPTFQQALQNTSFSLQNGDALYVIGDMVDRGPKSKEVLFHLLEMRQVYPDQVFLIKGNHEQMLQDWLQGQGNPELYLRYNGGDATIRSLLDDHPLRRAFLGRMPTPEEQDQARQVILSRYPQLLPALASLPLFMELPADPRTNSPPVLLVHAGIRPHVPLSAQRPEDLLWIRQPFYEHYDGSLPVIFGHTPVDRLPDYSGKGPWKRNNIIGIDGGAGYQRGVLLLQWPTLEYWYTPVQNVQSVFTFANPNEKGWKV